MERVNLHAKPSIIQVWCPTCCYQVCALDHAKGGTADLDHPSQRFHRNELTNSNSNSLLYQQPPNSRGGVIMTEYT